MLRKIFLLVSTCLVACLAQNGYDENLIRYKLWPMAAATNSPHPELCIADAFKNASLKRQITVHCDPLKNDTCSAFTMVSHDDKAILVVFRRTEGIPQTLEEVIDELFDSMLDFPGGAKVNYYFYTAFQELWKAGIRDDFLSLRNEYPSYATWVVGHSLGGAMASLCATYIRYLSYAPADGFKLVTFGQPRTGDLAYATLADKLIPYLFRISHSNDCVPHLPPLVLDVANYTHHKSEVWYNNDMAVGKTFVMCYDVNESYNCSNQLEKNLLDIDFLTCNVPHDTYFNNDCYSAMNGCPWAKPPKKNLRKFSKNVKFH